MAATPVVSLTGLAHGGEAVGRLPDGRTVFVAHALPGETVRVSVVHEQRRWCRAELVEVLEASPDRVTAPCPYFGPGQCGGCALQHVNSRRRRELLRQVVVDQLERLGGIPEPPVRSTVAAGDYGYRTRARFAVDSDGALGYRRHASHDIIPIDRCLLLDAPTQEARDSAGDQWHDHAEVEVRTGSTAASVIADPGKQGRVVMGVDRVTEVVDDHTFEVSSRSFFQANRRGAEILLQLVREAAGVGPGDTALDLYAGVGLFAAGLAADGAAVTAVEGTASAVGDARRNLPPDVQVLRASVERAVVQMARRGDTATVVVLDPPRRGAGHAVIDAVARVAERAIVMVACDAAALGRDAGLLVANGWRLTEAVPVDQFAQTAHVEVVATFHR